MPKSLLPIILLSIALLVSLTLVFRTTIFVNRAAVYSDRTPVLENSYLFASPLQANSKTGEKIRLTVFVLDNQGMGVANQPVSITSDPVLTTEEVQSVTNETGQAIFNLSSSNPQKYIIKAHTNQRQIPQTITVVFY